MRLCGLTSLNEATPALVNTLDVEHMVTSGESQGSVKHGNWLAKL